MTNEITPRFMKTRSAAPYIGRSVAWLKLARRGMTEIAGPEFLQQGTRIYYPVASLDAWLAQFPLMATLPQYETSNTDKEHENGQT